jgi:hypothetical protein
MHRILLAKPSFVAVVGHILNQLFLFAGLLIFFNGHVLVQYQLCPLIASS